MQRLKNVLLCLVFAMSFWGAFYVFARHFKFSENTALIVAVVGVAPIALLFFPIFAALTARVSKLKIIGVELELTKEVEVAVEGKQAEKIDFSAALDHGRAMFYGKASLSAFTSVLHRYQQNPRTRVILVVDVKHAEKISLPMLLFQLVLLGGVADLRSILFLDTRESGIDSRVLGTLSPGEISRQITNWIGQEATDHLWKVLAEGNSAVHGVEQLWKDFSERAHLAEQPPNKLWLGTAGVKPVFPKLERNLLNLPLTDHGLATFNGYLTMRTAERIILIRDDEVVTVRSIDTIARDIASKTVSMAIGNPGSQQPPFSRQ